jgi:integrase
VDLDGRCLRLLDSKEGKSIRPLGADASKLLANLSKDSRYVLPGTEPNKPFVGLPKAWRRIVGKDDLLGLTPHGLRHAFASVAADLGFAEPTIAALQKENRHRSITQIAEPHLETLADGSLPIANQNSPFVNIPLRFRIIF